jgi:hypothetical protein
MAGVEQWHLPADESAPAHARRLLDGALSTWSDPSDALLIASELAANMVRHGAAPFTLSAAVVDRSGEGPRMRLTATNVPRSPTQSPHVVQAEADALNGRGLAMVAALSDEWGWTQTDDLTTVWAVVTGSLSQPAVPTR